MPKKWDAGRWYTLHIHRGRERKLRALAAAAGSGPKAVELLIDNATPDDVARMAHEALDKRLAEEPQPEPVP